MTLLAPDAIAHRRELVRANPDLNGIDYLEVLDHDAGSKPLRQRTLLVHCLKPLPAGLTAANVRITGGVRVPVKPVWAAVANALPAGHKVPAAVLAALTDQTRVLVVRTDGTGDFSRYELALSGAADFDPLLSRVTFSFKVECPSDFDCEQETPPAGEQLAAPLIDYLAKDYQSFRRLMLDRLAVTMPEWKERSPADVGVALVEVLAYAADQLSYYQDAVATEAYLGTARRRVSARRHARLLDYQMHEGCNARAFVTVATQADGALIHAGDRFLTHGPADITVPPVDLQKVLDQLQPAVFEALYDLPLYRAHNEIKFYTWTAETFALAPGATSATLCDDPAKRLRLRAGDVLIFEAVLGAETGLHADADPGRRHAVRLTRVDPEADESRNPAAAVVDPLTGQAIVAVEWDAADALPFDLPIAAHIGGTPIADLSVARGNVVLVDHGLSIAAEPLDPPAVTGGARPYWPQLLRTDVTYAEPFDPALMALDPDTGIKRVQSAGALLAQEPRRARPVVELREGADLVWLPERHLLGSDRFAREFVLETENDGTARLRFGDGVHGRRPSPGLLLAAAYRVGNGAAGNVGAEAIAHLVSSDTAITGVRNPLPARGGVAPESLEEVRQYAPVAFRRQERAVTADDYVMVAQRHPEVARAAATLRWTGSWHTIFLTVERVGELPVDAAFRAELKGFLERFRLAASDVEVAGPIYVPLDIALEICVAPGYFRADVQQALLAEFSSGVLPDGRKGYFHPDHFTFGEPVYLSPIIAAAGRVPGVEWVGMAGECRFQRWGEKPAGEIAAGYIELSRLEIARLANDPSQPENGKITFLMRGGL